MVQQIDFKNNSLNIFRLLGALQVLCMHSYNHLSLNEIPILSEVIGFFSGVPIFFTLSGFLIWQSIGRSNKFGSYVKKRFWRIYPELWVAVIIEIIVILLLYRNPIDWSQMCLFALGQASIFQFWTPDFLRGYGCGTPNGALWTITVLIQFYFIVFFIYKLLHNKRLYLWGWGIGFSVILGCVSPYIIHNLPVLIGKIYSVTILPYLWMFIIAAFVSEYKDQLLPFLKNYWWIFFILIVLRRYVFRCDIYAMYFLFDTLLLFCGVLGFSYKFPRINIKTDISYGMYIYHMTVVNALIALGFVGQPWTLWFVIGITCLFAWLSTLTIGRISVNHKQKI